MPDPIKLALIEHLRRHMHARDLTGVQMAELLGISQPKVSSLMSNKTQGWSTGRLMQLVTETGFDVTIRVTPAWNRDATIVVKLP